jgi:hypothetical protein
LEEERPDALEVAAQKDEEREEEKDKEVILNSLFKLNQKLFIPKKFSVKA